MTAPNITTTLLSIPKIGLGTWPMNGPSCSDAVANAIKIGYRHIDTAERYENEAAVGAGIAAGLAESGVSREALFVTSKVWWDHLEPDQIRAALDASLERLGLDYLDLYLIHWPSKTMDLPAALKTLEALKAEGKIKAIGVSNFTLAHLKAVEETGIPIAALQVEYHCMLSQKKLLDWCRPRGIVLEAYAPIARGKFSDDPVLNAIAKKHGIQPLQVALAWLMNQELVVPIPKAQDFGRQKTNLDTVAVKLDAEDMAAIEALPKDQRQVKPDFAPDWD